ncbi:MAG: archease [Dehalococcoidia bacterium]|nr:archease [Dehalococcoidia bacterium]
MKSPDSVSTVKPFEVIEHTADIGIVAYGADIKQVFANAALGLFNLMADLDNLKEGVKREIELSAEDVEVLLVEWLNELIYITEVEHIIFKRFEINEFSNTRLKATCFGEKIKPGQHKLKREIKAATYHMLKLNKEDGSYKVQIIFDI